MYNELKPYMHVCQGKEKLFIYNEDLFKIVEPLGYAYDKYIPEIIKNLPSEQIRIFLNAFASCDGTPQKDNVEGFNKKLGFTTYNQYFTTSPRLMADLVECIYKTSKSCSVYLSKNKGKEVTFRNGSYKLNYDLYTINEMKTINRRLEQAEIKVIPYNDFVYDIEVSKNHTLLIKQGKSIHWNSNCRCRLEPVVTADWLENRRKIYNERHKFSFK